MKALEVLFSTDFGLLSMATIGIILSMAGYYVYYFVHHMHEDEARQPPVEQGGS